MGNSVVIGISNDCCGVIVLTCHAIAHFTVMDGSEAGGDRVLIQTFLLYYVNQVVLMLINIFKGNFP